VTVSRTSEGIFGPSRRATVAAALAFVAGLLAWISLPLVPEEVSRATASDGAPALLRFLLAPIAATLALALAASTLRRAAFHEGRRGVKVACVAAMALGATGLVDFVVLVKTSQAQREPPVASSPADSSPHVGLAPAVLETDPATEAAAVPVTREP